MNKELVPESVILDDFASVFYYGPTFEVVLPMKTKLGKTQYNILLNNEQNHSPFPFVVAVYKLVNVDCDVFFYKFQGCEIKNND